MVPWPTGVSHIQIVWVSKLSKLGLFGAPPPCLPSFADLPIQIGQPRRVDNEAVFQLPLKFYLCRCRPSAITEQSLVNPPTRVVLAMNANEPASYIACWRFEAPQHHRKVMHPVLSLSAHFTKHHIANSPNNRNYCHSSTGSSGPASRAFHLVVNVRP